MDHVGLSRSGCLFFLFLVSLAHWTGGSLRAETASALFSVVSPELNGAPFIVAAQ